MYWIKPIRIIFLNGLVFIHMKSWLCIYEIIPLLVSIHLLIMMQYDAIGTTYSNTSLPPTLGSGSSFCHPLDINHLSALWFRHPLCYSNSESIKETVYMNDEITCSQKYHKFYAITQSVPCTSQFNLNLCQLVTKIAQLRSTNADVNHLEEFCWR